jgi:hypothetical protein
MRSTREDALSILNKWKEEEAWLLVNGRFEERNEQHFFWARCAEVSKSSLVLAGEFTVLRIPLNSAGFEFADFSEAPEPTKSCYKHFESSLTMKSDLFLVALQSTISGQPAPILPPDVVHPEER